MQVAWLGEPASLDASTVGGKTANLGRLATSFRVPPGFCLDVSAFDELRPALDGDARARARLRELVAVSYADLARRVGESEPRVAVRSSAIGEDSGDASFAGQHETVLDVGGVDAIVDALLECWRSVYSERAAAYRKQRGITGTPRIAVLVQLMVPADASAIAFSADPVSGARDVVVINAARGLGDAIASGTITPDSYTVRKSDLAIGSRIRGGNGLAIPDDDIVAIARLAIQLETVMGGPVDIECAFRGAELHLLQCRPITTLAEKFPVRWDDPEDAKLTWAIESSHFHKPLSPLACDYIVAALYDGMHRFAVRMESPFRVRALAFNGRIYEGVKTIVPAETLTAEMTASTARRRAAARQLRRKWESEYLPELRGHYAWMRGLKIDRAELNKVADAWDELWQRLKRIWEIHFMAVIPAYAVMEELAQAYERLVGGDGALAFALTGGLAPTLQSFERDVHDLAEVARVTPAVAEAIRRGERSLSALRSLPGGDVFGAAADAFLATHGEVGQQGFDLGEPAFADDPGLLVSCIGQRLDRETEDPRARLARVRGQADEITRRLRAHLADRPADRARFEELLEAATTAGPLSEEHNYWIDRVAQAEANRVVRAVGARLVKEKRLRASDEIFFLHAGEVAAALRESHDLATLIAERAADMRRWSDLRAPGTLGAPPEAPLPTTPGVSLARIDLDYTVKQDDPYVLKGVSASPGVVRGPARPLAGGDFAQLRQGDVLVCRSTNASWVPAFTIASAVVTEIGGSLSHAAVVAREFGVPAVVAVDGALSTLMDGEPLEVDGSAGTVRRLFPVRWKDPNDAKLLWRRDDAHVTQVLTPLAIEYTRHGANYGMRRRDEEMGSPVLMRLESFNGRNYSTSQALRPPDEVAARQKELVLKRRSLARRMSRDWDERYLPELNEHYAWMRTLSLDRSSAQEAASSWDDLWRRHRRAWRIHMLVTSGAYAVMDELAETYQALVGGSQADAFALTQGLALTLQQLENDLHDLTEAARTSPRVAEAIGRASALDELRTLDVAFARRVDEFLRMHGEAGASGDHFGSVAWADDSTFLMRAVAQRVQTSGADPRVRHAGLRARANDIAAHARKVLAGRRDDLVRFEEVLAAASTAGPLTEEHNYWLDRRNHANMGRATRTFGARLVRDGVIRDREQIFLLYVDEVRDALREPRDLETLIAERGKEQADWGRMEAPETIGQQDAGPPAKTAPIWHLLFRAEQDDPSRALRGAPASAGIARGPARLVRNLEEFAKFQRGDVLVCQSSNVSWIPLFTSAAAVVTEVGGPLSHAAVVAREFGIPAVVGTAVALSTLVDGEPLEVDGSAGIVRRLSA